MKTNVHQQVTGLTNYGILHNVILLSNATEMIYTTTWIKFKLTMLSERFQRKEYLLYDSIHIKSSIVTKSRSASAW